MNPTEYTGKEIEAQPILVGEVVDDDGIAIAPEHGLVRRENPSRLQIEWSCMCGLPLGTLTNETATKHDAAELQQLGLAVAGIYARHIQKVEAQA